MENVLPPDEGYAPLEKAWRCIFPFDEECKGNIQRIVFLIGVALESPLGTPGRSRLARSPSRWTARHLHCRVQPLGK